jgi:ribose-phosphate pyrophosphokinase
MNDVELLADKNSRAWDFALKIQKYIKETKDLDVPLKEISIKHFNNGEIDMHVPENVRRKDIYFIHDSTKNPQEWWIELLLLKDLLLNASVESVTFILPDLLYSRKDRKETTLIPRLMARI